MTDRDFPRRIAAALNRHHLAADRLILEINEDALLGETDAAQPVADRLRRLGVRLWLDDFGAGHSSLLSLRQISLQAVKIDSAFVANIHTDPAAERLLRALLALGRDLGLTVTADGVELPEQAAVLRSLGCRLVQGNLYAHPAPAAQFDKLLGPLPTTEAPADPARRGHGHNIPGGDPCPRRTPPPITPPTTPWSGRTPTQSAPT